MVKYYQIQKTNSSEYNYVVISKNWYRLDDYISQVREDFHKKEFHGNVVFDCFLNNANSNRFFSAYFDGNNFDSKSFKELKSVDSLIEETVNKVYSKHIEWIENSIILSDAQKFIFKKKLQLKNKRKMQLA
ncbi:MAG: type II toxin-antitoxin system RnlB family antitoxin [Bacteroidetes bacterium]|nr:type II toxin-antitoxin system RnlB family antitoxin [Bacteroidota bacterium]